MRSRLLVALAVCLLAPPALAVRPVFDPAGASFYDLPFPHELRRDADGTVSIAAFPRPAGNAIVAAYLDAIERTPGFGVSSGVFMKLDGSADAAFLPATATASLAPDASMFLVNVDPRSRARGTRTPVWTNYRAAGDLYRDDHLLGLMPVPGHPLEPDTLYAAVATDALRAADGTPLEPAAAIVRLRNGTPANAFETAALPLYRHLWDTLARAGIARERVVVATIFRTLDPVRPFRAVERFVARATRPAIAGVTHVADRGGFDELAGTLVAPQLQSGTPPFTAAGSGRLVFDPRGRPVVQREENLTVVVSLPKGPMPRGGWPVVGYMHGTGGSRRSFITQGVAAELASVGVAVVGIDQPLHGLRAGATPDGSNFYNPLNPDALRDNPLQAATDSLTVHAALARTRIDPAAIGRGGPTLRFRKGRRLYMGHSQGATTGPLFLGVARGVRGGVISAGGGHLLVNILTREQEFFAGQTLRALVELLLGGPVDLFHPALHLLQMGSEVSDPVSFAPYFATRRQGRPVSLLFTHGMLDGYVTTPMTAAMVTAARYPLVAPVFPPIAFPLLPGWHYQEAFDLAGLPALSPPVGANLPRRATGGLILFEADGHFPVFQNPAAIAQYREFVRTLAYERVATIPVRE